MAFHGRRRRRRRRIEPELFHWHLIIIYCMGNLHCGHCGEHDWMKKKKKIVMANDGNEPISFAISSIHQLPLLTMTLAPINVLCDSVHKQKLKNEKRKLKRKTKWEES